MPATLPSSTSMTKKRQRDLKAYRLTCANCRSRKVKCDGEQPHCRICQAYGERCHYDKPPPMSQVLAMAHKIEELERLLATKSRIEASNSGPTSASQYVPSIEQARTSIPIAFESNTGLREVMRDPSMSESRDSPHYASTSAVEPAMSGDEMVSTGNVTPSADVPKMDESKVAFWEDAALENCSALLQLPADKVRQLLRTHWRWIHPVFMFVSRPAFLRDTAIGGPLSSHLLQAVLCLHSTRFCEKAWSEELLARVHLLLGQELHKEPSIPTVQALLVLSGHEIGKGRLSQSWLYSGMAFRMAVDMGIFVRPRSAAASDLQQAVEDQLAWSCYAWDKVMSLYLGRAPVLPEAPNFNPPILDEAAEDVTWTPYFRTEDDGPWPPVLSNNMSAFANFSKLHVLVNDILCTIYSRKVPSNPLPFVQQTRQKLEAWRAASPSHLIMLPGASHCPPVHIVLQNLLYYAATILLHRPFRHSAACRTACREAADEIERILLLYDKTIGLSHALYLMAYATYIAATVALLDMHDGIEGAQAKVNFLLRSMYACRLSCPAIRKSIDIILKGVEARHVRAAVGQPTTAIGMSNIGQDALPAFPFEQQYHHMQQAWTGSDGGMNTIPLGGLDSLASEWSQLPMDGFENIM